MWGRALLCWKTSSGNDDKKWQHSRFNHNSDMHIYSQGAWYKEKSAPAIIGNCSLDHNSWCRSSVSAPQTTLFQASGQCRNSGPLPLHPCSERSPDLLLTYSYPRNPDGNGSHLRTQQISTPHFNKPWLETAEVANDGDLELVA
ncbi:hypothetical protein AVEN_9317-1 [Araneus ventricosus]|uniref:Uncharacterized protein n=1 Tax=Araneus ventricosus TaxID=182803 RepID=A0A4Y2R2T8_ARAVE|nr:hypothetical protein AVEN_9317-1 [Araneus ventricosus]